MRNIHFSQPRLLLATFSASMVLGFACSGTEVLDRGVCKTLIACATQIAPQAEAEYLEVYGENGSCWVGGPSQWAACRTACRQALDALNLSGMVTGMTCGVCEADSDCVAAFGPSAVCDAGACVGGETGGSGTEGGDTGAVPEGLPALGISITEVEANQGSAVLIGQAGAWVEIGDRVGYLVANRDTLIRLQHEVEPGWAPREIAALLHLRDAQGNELPVRHQTMLVSGPSDPDVLETEFHFSISSEEALAGLEYWVELLDVDSQLPPALPAGDNTTPADFGFVGYDPRPVELNVVLVPVAYTFPAQQTYVSLGDAELATIHDTLYQTHPVQAVNLEVHGAYEQASELTHPGQLLAGLQTLRAQDGAAANVYYHALLDVGAAELGGASGAAMLANDTQADASRRVGVSLWVSAAASAGQIAHELGHNHGRFHVECPNPVNEAAGTDPNYPHANGSIGVHGYAVLDEVLYTPSTTADLMTHCMPRWTSDWTWNRVYERLTTLTSWN